MILRLNPSVGRDQLQLGTLSHVINLKAQGYQELPEWPQTAPDPSVRNVEVTEPWTEKYRKKPSEGKKKKKTFYSESEASSSEGKLLNQFVNKKSVWL